MQDKELKELLIWEIKYTSSMNQLEYIHRIIAKLHAEKKISTELLAKIDRYRKAKGEILKVKDKLLPTTSNGKEN